MNSVNNPKLNFRVFENHVNSNHKFVSSQIVLESKKYFLSTTTAILTYLKDSKYFRSIFRFVTQSSEKLIERSIFWLGCLVLILTDSPSALEIGQIFVALFSNFVNPFNRDLSLALRFLVRGAVISGRNA